MKTICIIPARGGSVRIERKNIKPFHGKPMLQRAIELARSCRLFDRIVVSTDDNEIAALAHKCGATVFRRPKDDGTRGTQEVARDVLVSNGFADVAIACVLYPCTPLLTTGELLRGYRTISNRDLGLYAMSVDEGGVDVGGYYWGWASAFAVGEPLSGGVTGCKVWRHFDINTPEDWARAEAAFTQPEKAPKVPAHGTEDTGTEEGETEESVIAAPTPQFKSTMTREDAIFALQRGDAMTDDQIALAESELPDPIAKEIWNQTTADFWSGAFGDEYTERNGRVPWSDRVPLWRRVLERTGAKSVLDVGCNAGWNLMALRAIDANIAMTGVDINEQALALAQGDGLDAEHCAAWDVTEKYGENACDLVVTSGVLIHVSPADLVRTMKAIRNTTNRWVLAIEYDAPQETEVTYRGHAGKLWKRPYGELYKAMGLALVEFGPAEGFDDCTYWLLEKP